jgi:hypothetical protein
VADSGAQRQRWSRNRVLPAVSLGLIALFVILAVAGGSKKSTAKSEPTARALAVQEGERAVTVLVPACETPGGAQEDAPGTTRVELPPGRGVRTVVVPNCTTGTGTQPSAAFVLRNDSELPPGSSAPPGTVPAGLIVGSRLTLPAGSDVRTIVVPPCGEKSKAKEDVVLRPQGGTVSAPAC